MAASSALHFRVEQLQAELASESTSIANLRQNVTAAAQQEAQTLAQLQSQVGHIPPRRRQNRALYCSGGGSGSGPVRHQFARQQNRASCGSKMTPPFFAVTPKAPAMPVAYDMA